jgi:hypothetical protein
LAGMPLTVYEHSAVDSVGFSGIRSAVELHWVTGVGFVLVLLFYFRKRSIF